MKNLSTFGTSRQEIIERWEILHPGNKPVAVGQDNNGKSTVLSEEINKRLVYYIAIFSRGMLLLEKSS